MVDGDIARVLLLRRRFLSDSIGGWLDAFVAEVDFGLTAMMGYVHEHGE